MPRYFALDAAIQLCVWDPQTASSSNTENLNVERTSSLAAGPLKNNAVAHPDKRGTSGPARGYTVHDLTEEYFEGHEGVDFIAPGMPFYLVKAGKELFVGDVENAGRFSLGFNGASPKPLTISVDLSAKSFMPSLFTNQRQEICITIFYNGELAHSRLLRPNTISSTKGPVGDEKCQYYSGRRIDSFLERPWVVRPHSANVGQELASSLLPMTQDEPTIRGFEERWNRINKALLAEADKWGHYGVFRSPVGEYLEELSKRAVPKFQTNEPSGGAQAGIIDIVITLGRSVTSAVSGLREPRRKLHEDRCGKARHLVVAPAELRPKKKAKIIADFNRETSRRSNIPSRNDTQNSNGTDATEQGTFDGKRPAYTVMPGTFKSIQQSSPYTPTPSLSQPFPLFATNSKKGANTSSVQSLRESGASGTPKPSRRASLPIDSSPLAHHPKNSSVFMAPVRKCLKTPNYVTQKGCEDTETPAFNPPLKQLKTTMDPKKVQHVSFDPQNSASASTHPRRTASSPATFSSNPTFSFTGDQMVDRRKIAHAMMSSIATKPNPFRGPVTSSISPNSDHDHSGQDSVDMILMSTPISGQQRLPADELKALETLQTTVGSPPANDSLSQNGSMLSGLDGSTDTPGRATRTRSLADSGLSCPRSESTSLAETPDSSVDQSTQQDSIAPRDTTRIVFDIKNTEASSAHIDRKKFEGLHIPGFMTKDATQELSNSPGKSAGQKSTVEPFVQKNKYVTENHPSAKARRKSEATAVAAASSPNASTSIEGAASSNPASTNSASRRQRKAAAADQARKSTTSVNPVPLTDPEGNRSDGGKGLSPTQKIDLTEPAKPVYQTPEKSGKSAAHCKTQSKPRSGSLSSTKRGDSASEESEKPKLHLGGKISSVSSRELKEMLPPHKDSMGVDNSFDSSFKEESKKAQKVQPSRNARPANPGPIGHDKEAVIPETGSIIPSTQYGTIAATQKTSVATGQASSLSRKAQIFPILPNSNEANERQVNNAITQPNQAPYQHESTSTSSSSKCVKLPEVHTWPVAAGAIPSIQGRRRKDSDLETADGVSKQGHTQSKPPDGPTDHTLPAGRTSRGYSVSSKGRKTPTSRKNSVTTAADPAEYEATEEEMFSISKLQQSAKGAAERRDSLSQIQTGSSKLSTASSRTTPAATWLQQDEPDKAEFTTPAKPKLSGPQTLRFSTPGMSTALRKKASAASVASGATIPSSSKVSISDESITFRTPTPAVASSAPTLASQSRSQAKRKAADISNSSKDNVGTPTRFWKPSSMCDDSVLTYATGGAFPGTTIDDISKNVVRNIKAEREGVFRASGVLMGVRYVVGLV